MSKCTNCNGSGYIGDGPFTAGTECPDCHVSTESLKTTHTHKANQFNSTDFTNCCGLAVLKDEDNCPRCKAYVLSRSKS